MLYANSFGFRSTPNAHYIANWLEQKTNIAARTASPRIVIAGGSNAFYGLSAKRISETFGVRAVNYATHGGLLLDYHLYKLRQILRPGDLLILPLEFEFYDADERPMDACIEYVSRSGSSIPTNSSFRPDGLLVPCAAVRPPRKETVHLARDLRRDPSRSRQPTERFHERFRRSRRPFLRLHDRIG